MLFPTVGFAVFFLVVFVLSWLLMPRPRHMEALHARRQLRLLRRLGLAVRPGPRGIHRGQPPLGHVISRCRPSGRARAAFLGVALAVNLGMLGWFKFFGFFASSLANTLRLLGGTSPVPVLEILVPVGISFFTFRAISYIVDVYRGTIKPADLLDFAVYMAFFPHLVAGPIVRGHGVPAPVPSPRDPRRLDADRAFYLILAGSPRR